MDSTEIKLGPSYSWMFRLADGIIESSGENFTHFEKVKLRLLIVRQAQKYAPRDAQFEEYLSPEDKAKAFKLLMESI